MFTFWHGNGRWRGYKATTILFASGIVKAFVDNYWVFSSIPLADEGDSITAKFFYLSAQIALNSFLFGSTGFGIDYLRSIYYQNENDTHQLVANS